MKRQHLFGLSTAVVALAVSTVATVAAPAAAGTVSCRTTMAGGLVGKEVVNSSSDVYAEAVAATQRVTIDRVTTNVFGQRRYRLAAPIRLVSTRGSVATTFKGGTGYFVAEPDLGSSSTFTACSRRITA